MRRVLPSLLALILLSSAHAQFTAGLAKDLVPGAAPSASSAAGAVGAKYSAADAIDEKDDTWWAAYNNKLPQWLEIRFAQPQKIDTLVLYNADNPSLYTNLKSVTVSFSAGAPLQQSFTDERGPFIIRFPALTTDSVRVTVNETYQPDKMYFGVARLSAYLDPDQQVRVKVSPKTGWQKIDLTEKGRSEHPCVYHTVADVQAARQRVKEQPWAAAYAKGVIAQADSAVARTDEWYRDMMPGKGACFAYGFTGCPICKTSWGTWGGARCSWDNPGHVTCGKGHVLPDAEHPDEGTGWKNPDGRIHYFVGSWNAWVTEKFIHEMAGNCAVAYSLTGDEKYARKAAFILDLVADIYPSCDAGSWDYPSNPPSGRLARPWYQVARVLVRLVDFYDQIYNSKSLDDPSVTAGLTRRQNIERNMLKNGAAYCYEQSLKGGLNNGEADYIRGALSVGALLGIESYVEWAYSGPYGIQALVHNNVCRDGRYFETSTMYADHTRELYLTFSDPLWNYRSEKYPKGIDIYNDAVFQSFYLLPAGAITCLGHNPRFGDSGPDLARVMPPEKPTSPLDLHFAEMLYARFSGQTRQDFGNLVNWLANDDLMRARAGEPDQEWLLFHADTPPAGEGKLPSWLDRRLNATNFFGQKGLAILRTPNTQNAQAALVRFGPSLNHGHADDLNLNYYALGYELTYDLGYSLGSTHTQVGWAKQTASHNLVMVDETPQGHDSAKDGSGGSMDLIAGLPGLQVTECTAPSTYSSLGVTDYRRVCALVGDGPETYLLDLFQVAGGKQHDYLFHALSKDVDFEGVKLSEPEPGSLAGPDVKWGELQGNDGDMIGHPNQVYWNPPPGNGLGFLMNPQRGAVSGKVAATWNVGQEDCHVKMTLLPEPGTEFITAWAPGIYPETIGAYGSPGGFPRSRYVIARRKSDAAALQSAYTAVYEPYARPLPEGVYQSTKLSAVATATAGEIKPIPQYQLVLFKATGPNDEMRLPLQVEKTGEYVINVAVFGSPNYGVAQLSVDGQAMPKLLNEPGTVPLNGSSVFSVGTCELTAGKHDFAVKVVKPQGESYWIGVQYIALTPVAAQPAEVKAVPFLRNITRLAAPEGRQAVRVEHVSGRQDTLIYTRPDVKSSEVTVDGVTTDARFARVSTREGKVTHLNVVGGSRLRSADFSLSLPETSFQGEVSTVDYKDNKVYTSLKLPTDGRLTGQPIYFSNPGYSRNTVYRIAGITSTATGSVIDLGQSCLLGFADLDDDPLDEHTITTLNPHEYSRALGRPDSHFFHGKLLSTADGKLQTTIRATTHAQPFIIKVDSVKGFRKGQRVYYYDLRQGDSLTIYNTCTMVTNPDGTALVTSTSNVNLKPGVPVQFRVAGNWTATGGAIPWQPAGTMVRFGDNKEDDPAKAPAGVTAIEPRGRLILSEDFKTDLANWQHEGGGKLSVLPGGKLRLDCTGSKQGSVGCHAFLKAELPDNIAIEYDLQVHKSNGLIIAFVGMQGLGGEDMFTLRPRTGIFADYVGVDSPLRSYHVSVSRYNDKGEHTGVSNWRRNPGAHLAAQGPDLCKDIGQVYHVRLIKDGPHVQLSVNGQVAHDFTDPQDLPVPLPTAGRFGFRAIGSEVIADISNFRVKSLR